MGKEKLIGQFQPEGTPEDNASTSRSWNYHPDLPLANNSILPNPAR